jgi:hypothetical protein
MRRQKRALASMIDATHVLMLAAWQLATRAPTLTRRRSFGLRHHVATAQRYMALID